MKLFSFFFIFMCFFRRFCFWFCFFLCYWFIELWLVLLFYYFICFIVIFGVGLFFFLFFSVLLLFIYFQNCVSYIINYLIERGNFSVKNLFSSCLHLMFKPSAHFKVFKVVVSDLVPYAFEFAFYLLIVWSSTGGVIGNLSRS